MMLDALFDMIQKACLPGVWSKGVTLARGDAVIADSSKGDEIVLRVRAPDHPVSRKVSLWPEDEDWYCDFGNPNDVCSHVAAAVISLRSGKIQAQASSPTGAASSRVLAAQVHYRFTRQDGGLSFERWIFQGEQ